jgi:hypothetical protein
MHAHLSRESIVDMCDITCNASMRSATMAIQLQKEVQDLRKTLLLGRDTEP